MLKNIDEGRLLKRTSIGLAAFFLLASTAWAGSGTPCSATVAGKVDPNSGCEVGTQSNDSEASVNSDMLFGNNDWSLLGKLEFDETNSFDMGGVTISGDGQSGTFTIDVADGIEVMLVFKGPDFENYIAYLVENGSGTYETPFSDSLDTSHISVYTRGSATVPEPGSLLLLGSGLVALEAVRRRRRP